MCVGGVGALWVVGLGGAFGLWGSVGCGEEDCVRNGVGEVREGSRLCKPSEQQ